MCPSTSDLITARLSAYADDVTVIIRSAQDAMKVSSSRGLSESLLLSNQLAKVCIPFNG